MNDNAFSSLPKFSQYVLIGNGKLASHLVYLFQAHQFEFLYWKRQSKVSLKEFILKLSNNPTLFLMAVTDSSLNDVIDQCKLVDNNSDHYFLHFSGATVIDQEHVFSAHPLFSFSHQLLQPVDEYQTIPWILDQEHISITSFFPFLKHNPSAFVSKANRSFYHALCVAFGNFPQMIWQEAFKSWEQLGLDKSHLSPYLNQVLQNFLQQNRYLTGPFARGDQKTFNVNADALLKRKCHYLSELYELNLKYQDLFIDK